MLPFRPRQKRFRPIRVSRFSVALFVRRFRRGRSGEFLKVRIIPERIEHGIEPEQGRSKWHGFGHSSITRYGEQFL
jgi:hypothetical protein